MAIFSLLLHKYSYAEKLLKAEPRLKLFSWNILQFHFIPNIVYKNNLKKFFPK